MSWFASPASLEALDTLWRIELLHPMVVHFPIALLLTGAVAWLVALVTPGRDRLAFLRPAATVLLAAGTVGAWMAVWSGDLADQAIGRDVPNAPLLEDHENLGTATAVLASVLLGVDLLLWWLARNTRPGRPSWRRLAHAAAVLLILATAGAVTLTAHQGAALVYAEGAAVQTRR
ncbi:hypothetical protein GF314_02695 [bacterium]|nr:hypothetical protein [bacterium]